MVSFNALSMHRQSLKNVSRKLIIPGEWEFEIQRAPILRKPRDNYVWKNCMESNTESICGKPQKIEESIFRRSLWFEKKSNTKNHRPQWLRRFSCIFSPIKLFEFLCFSNLFDREAKSTACCLFIFICRYMHCSKMYGNIRSII